MFEGIKDTLSDIKEAVGDKWFYLLIGGAVAFGIYNLLKNPAQSSSEEGTVYYEPTGVTGFADLGSNADVVMDSVNNTIEAQTETIMGFIDSMTESNNTMFDEINAKMEGVQDSLSQTTEEVKNAQSQVNSLVSKVDNIENRTESILTATKQNTNTSATKTTTQSTQKISTPASSPASTPAPAPATYNYTTQSGLNTSTSIVDALKASGNDSSFEARKKIAEANGISNYTGSASQNVALLNMMKSGNLKKA